MSASITSISSPSTASPTRPIFDSTCFVVGIACLLAAGVLNWICYSPPLQDYSQWIQQSAIIHALLGGVRLHGIVVKHWPVPNCAAQLAMASLMFVFSPVIAAKIFISIYLVLVGLVAWLIGTLGKPGNRGATFILVVSLVGLHGPYWTGEINFQLGLLALLLCLYQFERLGTIPPYRTLPWSILLFSCHALCFAIFCIYSTLTAKRQGTLTRTLLALMPMCLCLCWYKIADPRHDFDLQSAAPHLVGVVDQLAYRVYEIAKTGPYQNMVFDGAGDLTRARRLFFTGLTINLLFGALLVRFLYSWLKQERRAVFAPPVLTGLFCFGLAILNPVNILSIGNLPERLIDLGLLFPLITYRPSGTSDRAILAALSCFLLVCVSWFALALPKDLHEQTSVTNAAMNGDSRLSVLFWHRPFLFAGSVAAAQDLSASRTVSIGFETSILQRPDSSK